MISLLKQLNSLLQSAVIGRPSTKSDEITVNVVSDIPLLIRKIDQVNAGKNRSQGVRS